MTEITPSPLNNVITVDDERIKSHLDRVVRGSVEETLNALLDAEADRLCNAQRYERREARRDTRAGHYERKLKTKAGEVKLRIPKLRTQTFETARNARLGYRGEPQCARNAEHCTTNPPRRLRERSMSTPRCHAPRGRPGS